MSATAEANISGLAFRSDAKALDARLFVDRGDLGALVEEIAAEALPDAARGAGDRDHLAFECFATPRIRHPFNAPSISPLKNSFCANVKAMMPGVTTIT